MKILVIPKKINIKCEGCGITHEVTRDKEAPIEAVSMGCNWCPECEDKAGDYYKEWYEEKQPVSNPNQLTLIWDNL